MRRIRIVMADREEKKKCDTADRAPEITPIGGLLREFWLKFMTAHRWKLNGDYIVNAEYNIILKSKMRKNWQGILEDGNICKRCSFECGIGKYSTRPRNKVWAFRRTPYSLDMCCIFSYCTKMNTVGIFSHNCPNISKAHRSVQPTDMTTDDRRP